MRSQQCFGAVPNASRVRAHVDDTGRRTLQSTSAHQQQTGGHDDGNTLHSDGPGLVDVQCLPNSSTIRRIRDDNGPVLDDGYEDQAVELCGEHRPVGLLRGDTYSLYDGGTRVPFTLRWTGTVELGQTSALVSHLDVVASLASLLGLELVSGRVWTVSRQQSVPRASSK